MAEKKGGISEAERVIEAVDTVGGVARIARASRVISHKNTRAVFEAIKDELSEDRVYDIQTGTFTDRPEAGEATAMTEAEAEALSDVLQVATRVGAAYETYGGVPIADAIPVAEAALERLAPESANVETRVDDGES